MLSEQFPLNLHTVALQTPQNFSMFWVWAPVRGSTNTSLWFTVRWLHPASLRQLQALQPSSLSNTLLENWHEVLSWTLIDTYQNESSALLFDPKHSKHPWCPVALFSSIVLKRTESSSSKVWADINENILPFFRGQICSHQWKQFFQSFSNFQVTFSLHSLNCRFADSTCSMSTCRNLSPCENLQFKSKQERKEKNQDHNTQFTNNAISIANKYKFWYYLLNYFLQKFSQHKYSNSYIITNSYYNIKITFTFNKYRMIYSYL